MKKPLNWENRDDANDLINIHNPGKYDHTLGEYVQINPAAPTGLEPPPPDYQYDVPHQMKKPLIFENREDANDLRNVWNPNKYEHSLGNYISKDGSTTAAKTAVKTDVK